MDPLRLLAPLAVFIGVATSVGSATATIVETPDREQDEHSFSTEKRFWISYEDCIKDDVFTFNLTLTDYVGKNLEVWAGQSGDCVAQVTGQDDSSICWRVYLGKADDTQEVEIRAQDIATRARGQLMEGKGTKESCLPGDMNSAGYGLSLHFLLTSGSEATETDTYDEIGLDLVGPEAPTGVTATSQERKLGVEWDADDVDTGDWNGYRIYCAPPEGAPAPASPDLRPLANGGGAGGDATVATGGSATATGGSATASGGTGGTSSSAGSDGRGDAEGTVDEACDFGFLVPGEVPGESYDVYRCGGQEELASTNTGLATGLENGVLYQVAVAGIDEFDNVGPLSNVACGTPQPVTTFYEAYRAAGGTGAGFCSFSMGHRPGIAALLSIASLVYAARRRRRRQG